MSCEKLKLIEGNLLNFSISSSWISSRVMGRRHSSWPMNATGLVRQCSIGVKGALNSMLKKLVTSVPSSGRPTCDITPLISGIAPITSRSRGAIRAASSERHRPRQDGADPQVPLLQGRHELAAQLGDQRDREGQQCTHRA